VLSARPVPSTGESGPTGTPPAPAGAANVGLAPDQRKIEGKIPSCSRYLATVRRATTIPFSANSSAICSSVRGVASWSIMSLITSFAEREGVKKWLKGTTSPEGSMTYFDAVARETVDSWTPSSTATMARVRGRTEAYAFAEILTLEVDQVGHDPLQRLPALIDVGHEQPGPRHVLLDVLLLVVVEIGLILLRAHHQLTVERVDPQEEALRLDDVDLETAVALGDDHVRQDVARGRAVRRRGALGRKGVEVLLDELGRRRHLGAADMHLLGDAAELVLAELPQMLADHLPHVGRVEALTGQEVQL